MRALKIIGTVFTAGMLLSGCDSSKSTVAAVTETSNVPSSAATVQTTQTTPAALAKMNAYKVTVKNLTFAQPMAPMALVYHNKETSIFKVGQSASEGLERLAEGGDNTLLLSELSNNLYVKATKGGNGLILPSKSDTVTLEGSPAECISVTAMLVNTNDAFTGVDCVDVSSLKNGEILSIELPTYDAGTEGNTEAGEDIPGPAGGGEGFNASRDDRDFVAMHGGVVSKDDELSTSVLTYAHKWDNPTAMLMIERVK